MDRVFAVDFTIGKGWLPVAFALIGSAAVIWHPRLGLGGDSRSGSSDRTLSAATTFGRSIAFLPAGMRRPGFPRRDDEIVAELRALAGASGP